MIHIFVQSIGGEQLEMDLEQNVQVIAIKQKVSDIWQIPMVCQQLVHNTSVIDDYDYVNNIFATEKNGLRLALVVCLDFLAKELATREENKVIRALGDFAKLGLRAGASAFASVIECLDIGSRLVRVAAVETLGAIAKRGDEQAIDAVNGALIQSSCGSVWEAAIKVLAVLTRKEDGRGINAASLGLQHRDKRVRIASLYALSELTHKGDERAVAAMICCLRDKEVSVTVTALEVLRRHANIGDDQVIQAVTACLRCWDTTVRKAAIFALRTVMEQGDESVVATLVEQLHRNENSVVVASLETLRDRAKKGDENVVSALIKCLQFWNRGVRQAAAEALEHVAEKYDQRVIAAVEAWGEDEGSSNRHDLRATAEKVVKSLS